MTPDLHDLQARYEQLFGYVPDNVRRRSELAELAGHPAAIAAVEHFRQVLLHDNPLAPKIQQLVHFALLIGAGADGPARLHAQGALKAGATVAELFGVCETAAITGGMPAFSRAVEAVYAAVYNADARQSEPLG